jgi:hypothetical protein
MIVHESVKHSMLRLLKAFMPHGFTCKYHREDAMNHFRPIISTIAFLLLAGCFQASTVVRVNPDGSGTVSETTLLSKRMIAQMNEVMQGFAGENGAKPEPLELFEPDRLKAQAAGMGEGVTYLSCGKSENADYSGYTATYAFKDINKLRLGQKSQESAGGAGGQKAPSMPVLFQFTKGPPATLTIEQPREKSPAKGSETPADKVDSTPEAKNAIPDGEAKQLAEMFMGMKMSLAVEVNGAIIETNATHRDGSRITIIDFDLAKFGTSLPQLEKLKLLQGSSAADAMELMKDFPGMKVDLNDRLKVVFGE